MSGLFRAHIAIPQDHGAWVFLLSPLVIGIAAGGQFNAAAALLTIASLAAFVIRQPAAIAVKALSGRRARTDLRPAVFWMAIDGLVLLAALTGLVLLGAGYVLFAAIPALPVFAWHLWLVSRRSERRQAGVEILAAGVLALAAPAVYWTARGGYAPEAWWLWLLTWLQSAASIVYAYLRLQQRELPSIPTVPERWHMGWRALLYTGFNLLLAAGLGLAGLLPRLIFLPYLLQFAESLYGTLAPAVGVKPTHIGLRQLAISALFTLIFVIVWRLS